MRSTKIIFLVFLAALGALLITACGAGLFPQMSYQGVLTDDNGQPINGSVQFTYRLFDTATGGTQIYANTETVAVTNGLFNSVVGPSTIVAGLDPADLTKPLYLEIQVANGVYTETLTPRQRLYGSPYAFTLMPGSVISSTLGGVVVTSSPVQAVTTIRNEYINTPPDDLAVPALRLMGDVPLELGGRSGGNNDAAIFSDRADSDSDFEVHSNDQIRLYLDEDNNESSLWRLFNGAGNEICFITELGNLTCDGTKSATVEIEDEERLLYAVESPGVWFEDFGSGTLVGGQAVVTIEPLFAQSVNLGVEYHVFLTPLGDCSGLYVAEKTATGFTVRELNGGTSNIAFDYRIVAKRTGYEDMRLELAAPTVDEE
jgi:hypothetical protein